MSLILRSSSICQVNVLFRPRLVIRKLYCYLFNYCHSKLPRECFEEVSSMNNSSFHVYTKQPLIIDYSHLLPCLLKFTHMLPTTNE